MRKREFIIIGVILLCGCCLLSPWLISRREQSRRDVCEYRLMFLAIGAQRCETSEGAFPAFKNLQAINYKDETVTTGWTFRVLPFVGYDTKDANAAMQNALAAKSGVQLLGDYAKALEPYGDSPDANRGGDVPSFSVPAMLCPADDTKLSKGAACSFVANTGMPDATGEEDADQTDALPFDWQANGLFFNGYDDANAPQVTLEFVSSHDGAESTLLFAENVDAGKWTDTNENKVGFVWATGAEDSPAHMRQQVLRVNQQRGESDGSYRFARPSAFHVGGANVAFASGRTQFLDESIAPTVYAQMMAPDDANAKYAGSETPVDWSAMMNDETK